jgi:hypothetical protein
VRVCVETRSIGPVGSLWMCAGGRKSMIPALAARDARRDTARGIHGAQHMAREWGWANVCHSRLPAADRRAAKCPMPSDAILAAFQEEVRNVGNFLRREALGIEQNTASAISRLHAALDEVVNSTDGSTRAFHARLGSIGVTPAQIEVYSRLAASLPPNSSVCEVGFNVGHSAVLWLLSNPAVTLHTFDLFKATRSLLSLETLTRLFPGRIVSHKGDSLDAIPRLSRALSPPCALVHIDGCAS